MFTGIVTDVGTVRATEARGPTRTLTFGTKFERIQLGESIAVDGVCLTVVSATAEGFTADASAETLARTALGARRVGDRVNLERALAVGDRMGGHFVAGHVDGIGRVRAIVPAGDAQRWTFEAPPEVHRYIAEKGSITVDGVSLTVNGVAPMTFEVMLVPFTLRETNLRDRAVGDAVNLEADLLARYVARALEGRRDGSNVTEELLARAGFTER